jgi:NAD(P)-dependent dehydrogenase (short-subunit alcohol dehydrogenase family)
VLVNNAANDHRDKVAEMDQALWDDRIAVNVRHHFFAAQAVAG